MACWYPSPWWPRWEGRQPEEGKTKAKRKPKAKKKEAVTT